LSPSEYASAEFVVSICTICAMNLRNSIPEHFLSYELVLAVIIAHGGNATRKGKDGALTWRALVDL
jgi:hypothetical protein